MEETLYTAGEIARIAGVSLRTIRFYDEKGLLKPVSYSEAGYRYYNQESLAILQRILMLKYLGFSLQRIEEVMASRNMELQLSEQKELLIQKKRKLEEIISSIELMENSREKDKCGFLIRLLNLLTEDEKIQEQYRTADNLEKRIRLHDYSTSPLGWMEWVYERLELKAGERVLELGCGTGLLWQENARRLPEGLRLTLTDRSEGMLEKAREKFAGRRFQGIEADYFEYPFPAGHFDAALSFETLHHFPCEKKGAIYEKLFQTLKNGGYYIECDYVACCQEEEDLCRERLRRARAKSALPEDVYLHIDTPLTLEHQTELMERAGFQVKVLYQNCGTVVFRAEKQ